MKLRGMRKVKNVAIRWLDVFVRNSILSGLKSKPKDTAIASYMEHSAARALQDQPNLRRRMVLISAGALFAATQPVEAATIFTNYTFPGSNFPTSRTMSARIAEIKNVKDFGAVGDGSTDDRAAIQAAVGHALAPYTSSNVGVIWFPPTTASYKLNASVIVDGTASIILQGVAGASRISGTFNDFLIKRAGQGTNQLTGAVRTIQDLDFINGHATGGGVQWNANIGGAVRNCTFSANRCLDLSFCQSTEVSSCLFSTGGNSVGSYGIVLGENGLIQNCDASGFYKAIMIAGVGANIIGCRMEVCVTAISIGDSTVGPLAAGGFTIQGGSFESCIRCIDFVGGGSFGVFQGLQALGFEVAAPYAQTIVSPAVTATGSASGATAQCTITAAGIATLSGVSGTFVPGHTSASDFISGTNIPKGSKLYDQLTGVAGKDGTYSLSGSPEYVIRIPTDSCQHCVFSSIIAGGQCSRFNISVLGTTNRKDIVFMSVFGDNSGNASTLGGAGWEVPTSAHTAQFISCDINPTYLFSGLPTAGNVRESDMYYITDGNQSTLGGNVTAGGSNNKGWVTYNGTAWTLMSK